MDGWQESACLFSGTAVQPAETTVDHVVYDPHKPLVWVSDSVGRVSSWYVPFLKPYTSFLAHSGIVYDLKVTESRVWSIGDDGVRCHTRSGLPKLHASHAVGTRLCITESEVLVSTDRRVNIYNADSMRETGTFAIDAPGEVKILFLQKTGPSVCLGLSDGSIQILDPDTFDTVQTVRCHTGPLTDLDCRKNMVMTCGMSLRRYGVVQDQIVYVYDSRAFKSLPLLPVSTGARFVRMHPRSPTNCVVLAPTGQVHFLDAKDPGSIHIQQVAVVSEISGMDISPSGDAIVVVEKNGLIHHWTRSQPGDSEAVPQNLPLPTAPAQYPPMSLGTPLSAVGLPYYKTELLSSWSEPFEFEVGMPPPRDLHDAKRNVATKYVSVLKVNRRTSTSVPRFLSERDRLGGTGSDRTEAESLFEIEEAAGDHRHGRVPRVYQLQQIHYSKFGVDDFDFKFYNKTEYSGLENRVAGNTYCNALLQVLRWSAPIHNWALAKFAEYNYKPMPMVGEIATLFDMLHKAMGRQCQASNFLSMLGNNPEAKTRGLLDVNRPDSEKLFSLHELVLEELTQEETTYMCPPEADGKEPPQPEFRDLSNITITCRMYGACGYRTDMMQSAAVLEAGSADHKGLSSAASRTTDSWLWCEQCAKHHSMAIVRQVTNASPVLFVKLPKSAAAPVSAKNAPAPRFSFTPRADKRSFKVVDSDSPQYVLSGYVAEIHDGRSRHLVAITKVNKTQWVLFNDFLVKPLTETEALDFSHSWRRPLLLVYQHPDVLDTFDYSEWKEKLDTRLLYERHLSSGNMGAACTAEPLEPGEIKEGYLAALDAEFVLLDQEVAEIHSDGTKFLVQPRTLSLARVSVVRGTGSRSGTAFIDDFIEMRQPVLDYVTLYSGIRKGDLDPETSPHGLVTQQTATRRLWILLNLGCIFIGHALINDFRTINLQVPPEQIIDTFDLFYDRTLSGPRRLSLKFLVWALLGDQVQTGNHDSIEDSVSALRLYNKYIELKHSGELETELAELYSLGKRTGFKVPMSS